VGTIAKFESSRVLRVLRPNVIFKQMPVSLIFYYYFGTGTTKKTSGCFVKVQSLFTELTLITLQYTQVSKLIVSD
jgi:hypothetical protein